MSDTPETIYLIPDYDEGVLGHVWCDDPAPGTGMDPEDAIEYRRADVEDTELAAAKARIAELEKALEPFARWYLHGVCPSKQERQSAAAALLKDK